MSVQNSESEDDDMYCPPLPPHLLQKNDEVEGNTLRVIGPTLPPTSITSHEEPDSSLIHEKSSQSSNDKQALESSFTGDSSNPEVKLDNDSFDHESESDSDDNDTIGPLPPSVEDKRFEGSAMEHRMKTILNPSQKNENVRESWMLELPSDRPKALALGLSARQFRKNAVEYGDRSVWTDTPEDKKRKEMEKGKDMDEPSIEELASRKRDEELTELVGKHNQKKRNVSLIDMHSKKKSKYEKSEPSERKPFSREEDLNVNRFDEAQRQTILKKAQHLNDRFSSGGRKFL